MSFTIKRNTRLAVGGEIFLLTVKGILEKTEMTVAPRCQQCHRYDHGFQFGGKTIWCCANEECMDQRLTNAESAKGLQYPINFLKHLRKRSKFETATLTRDGVIDDFVDKWDKLKNGDVKDIFIHGEVGVGKTASMYAALHDLCKIAPQFSSLFLTETELYETVKKTFNKYTEFTEEEIIKKISSVDFLFLDDLGSATRTNQGEWGKQVFLDILDERANNLSVWTIISSNFSVDELECIYNARISDRFKFMTHAYMKGESRRKPIESHDQVKKVEEQLAETKNTSKPS